MIEILKKRYDVMRRIGQGGMAEVYLAYDKFTKKDVAIKILRPEQRTNIIHKERFLSEIQLTEKVNSNNVIKILDYKWEDNVQYIVMEYIEGKILKNYISEKGRLLVEESVEFSKQIAQGLESIHKAGIVHRDIKSTNIMITNEGVVKIIDFGIALNDESKHLTRTGHLIGSAQYIAPEIVRQESKGSIQSDIYALGILMYEMLTGSLPIKGKTVPETAYAHMKQVVPNISKLFPNVPQPLSNVVLKATAKKTAERYKNTFELYKDLMTCLNLERANESKIVLSEKKKKSFKDVINSKWFLLGMGILIILILVAVIVALVVAG